MKRLMLVGLTIVCLGGSFGQSYAQVVEDTTPPQLIDLIINTPVVDTTASDAEVLFTVRVADDLSGPNSVRSTIRSPSGVFNNISCSVVITVSPLEDIRECRLSLPQFSPLGTYQIDHFTLVDEIGNAATVEGADLAQVGFPTTFENADLTGQPDSDDDGVPDAGDNCPDDHNPGQEDADFDLLGDVCDPFPEDRDNEQAQCEADRDQAFADLDMCLALPKFQDDDSDGEENSTDLCPETAVTDRADADGCSLAQFCALFDATTRKGRKGCRKGDWLNDEPSAASPKDCLVDKSRDGGAACVPRM